MDLSTMLDGIVIKHSFTLSANDDWQNLEPKPSLEVRLADGTTIRLKGEFHFDNVTLGGALDKAIVTARIAWQGANRSNFAELSSGDTVQIMVARAGKAAAVDPEVATAAIYASGDHEARVTTLMKVTGDSREDVEAMIAVKTAQ